MQNNLEKYKEDLKKLVNKGDLLMVSMQFECFPERYEKAYKEHYGEKYEQFRKKLLIFKSEYQSWYSEALSIIKLILPDRINDFIKLYEKPRARKEIQPGNYVIEDYLQGMRVTRRGEVITDGSDALPQFEQQVNILKSVDSRFDSTLFDIKQLMQADLFDSEIEAARELSKNKFYRAAGAVAGVVLEKHLAQVSDNHGVSTGKKDPSINDYNELLKKHNIIDVPQWRFIQHLGDIRNLCDHNKPKDPTALEVTDLIDGVDKISKTIY